jgi:DNA-directed RNA polymerase specialized sigma24 family protein
MNNPSDSILLCRLKASSDPMAAQSLWARYFDRLAAMARRRLTERTRRVADEEDIALSAFDSFFRGVADGRFPKLNDHDDLWQVLVLLTERKAIDRIRRATADKRGGNLHCHESLPVCDDDDEAVAILDQLAGTEPNPEFAALFEDECRRLLSRLGDVELTQLALWKFEGLTNEEIATRLGRAVRSVQRKLETIRKIWETVSRESE